MLFLAWVHIIANALFGALSLGLGVWVWVPRVSEDDKDNLVE
jgi:hypothetical protein